MNETFVYSVIQQCSSCM